MTQRFQEYQMIMNEHVITAQQNAKLWTLPMF